MRHFVSICLLWGVYSVYCGDVVYMTCVKYLSVCLWCMYVMQTAYMCYVCNIMFLSMSGIFECCGLVSVAYDCVYLCVHVSVWYECYCVCGVYICGEYISVSAQCLHGLCVCKCVCICEYECVCVCVLCACLPTLVSPVQIQASLNILESEISQELLRLRPASKTEWGKALSLVDV